ncbi:MAG: hypothetical protein ABEJ27_07150 [Halodesulfurarchaeum sp.]
MANRHQRAAAPVAGKALEIAIVLLYIGLVSGALYGTAIPTARGTAEEAVSDRALAAAIGQIRAAIPSAGTGVVRVDIELPTRIGGVAYHLVVSDGYLVLEHPDPDIGGRGPLLLPDRVTSVRGRWDSTESPRLIVTATETGVRVRLTSGEGP